MAKGKTWTPAEIAAMRARQRDNAPMSMANPDMSEEERSAYGVTVDLGDGRTANIPAHEVRRLGGAAQARAALGGAPVSPTTATGATVPQNPASKARPISRIFQLEELARQLGDAPPIPMQVPPAAPVANPQRNQRKADPRMLDAMVRAMQGDTVVPEIELQNMQRANIAARVPGTSRPTTGSGWIDAHLAERRAGRDPATGMGPQREGMANMQGVDRPIVGAERPFDPSVAGPRGQWFAQQAAAKKAMAEQLANPTEKPMTQGDSDALMAELRAKPRTVDSPEQQAALKAAGARSRLRTQSDLDRVLNARDPNRAVRNAMSGALSGDGGMQEEMMREALGLGPADPRLKMAREGREAAKEMFGMEGERINEGRKFASAEAEAAHRRQLEALGIQDSTTRRGQDIQGGVSAANAYMAARQAWNEKVERLVGIGMSPQSAAQQAGREPQPGDFTQMIGGNQGGPQQMPQQAVPGQMPGPSRTPKGNAAARAASMMGGQAGPQGAAVPLPHNTMTKALQLKQLAGPERAQYLESMLPSLMRLPPDQLAAFVQEAGVEPEDINFELNEEQVKAFNSAFGRDVMVPSRGLFYGSGVRGNPWGRLKMGQIVGSAAMSPVATGIALPGFAYETLRAAME